MGKPIIERYWNGGSLRYHNKIRRVYKEITSDIAAGVVFPAVRENEIHLYHEGGRIFRITPRSTYTHSRYLGKQGDRDVSLKALALEDYESIKECCEAHNSRKLKTTDEWQERWIVSRLFRRFSCWSEHAERGQPKLVDIEVSFRRGWERLKIDLLFLEAEGRLRFVEVKRQYDPRVRSRGSKPEVLEQIRRYEDLLKNGQDRIVCVYRDVSKVLDEALEVERFSQPMEVFPLVPVLVCRKDARDGQDRWLREQFQSCAHDVIGKHLIVDGGSIDGGLYRDIGHPSWCPDGRWERLNLREVFQKVDESRT